MNVNSPASKPESTAIGAAQVIIRAIVMGVGVDDEKSQDR